jgi:hypothetical protein
LTATLLAGAISGFVCLVYKMSLYRYWDCSWSGSIIHIFDLLLTLFVSFSISYLMIFILSCAWFYRWVFYLTKDLLSVAKYLLTPFGHVEPLRFRFLLVFNACWVVAGLYAKTKVLLFGFLLLLCFTVGISHLDTRVCCASSAYIWSVASRSLLLHVFEIFDFVFTPLTYCDSFFHSLSILFDDSSISTSSRVGGASWIPSYGDRHVREYLSSFLGLLWGLHLGSPQQFALFYCSTLT